MGISEEIDVTTIDTDKAKILESKSDVRIAISLKFDNVNRAKTVKKPVCCTFRVFSCFAYFPVFVFVVVSTLNSLVSWLGALPRKTILAMRRLIFAWELDADLMKNAPRNCRPHAGTHPEAQSSTTPVLKVKPDTYPPAAMYSLTMKILNNSCLKRSLIIF